MFAGHFGVGFGLKRWAPELSLGTLFLAAQLVDLIWPTLLLFNIENVRIEPGATLVTPLDFHHYPFTHSLLGVGLWALGFAIVCRLLGGSKRAVWIAMVAVVSHWGLDLLVHRPDLPLVPWSELKMGLGGWNSLLVTMLLEGLLFGAGVWWYGRSTTAIDATGRWAFYGLVGFIAMIQVGNFFGPPPPSVTAIAVVGHAQWLLVLWGWWIDRHRKVNGKATKPTARRRA